MEENTQIIRQRLFKTENYLGDFDPNKQGGYDQLDKCSLFGCVWESKIDDNESAPATWDGGDVITPNTQDWKQVSGDYEAWLLNKDKPATTGTTGAHPYNGMGRVVLKKNMVNVGTEADPEYVNTLTQDMFYKGEVGSRVPNTDTVFVIKYDYVLGEDITVPVNCVLKFEGGSISNASGNAYSITGANTSIKEELVKIFNTNITLAGTWNIVEAYPEWFGAIGDGINDDSIAINMASNWFDGVKVRISSKTYLCKSAIFVSNPYTKIVGSEKNSDSIIKADDLLTDPLITFNGMRSSLVGVHIVGNRTAGDGIVINSTQTETRECLVENCGNRGILLAYNPNGSHNKNIINCRVYTCKGPGIQSLTNDLYITGCEIANNEGDCQLVISGANNRVINCHVWAGDQLTENTNCDGIKISNADAFVVSNCTLDRNMRHAINVSPNNGTIYEATISNNIFYNNGKVGKYGQNIYVGNNVNNISIIGNVFRNDGGNVFKAQYDICSETATAKLIIIGNIHDDTYSGDRYKLNQDTSLYSIIDDQIIAGGFVNKNVSRTCQNIGNSYSVDSTVTIISPNLSSNGTITLPPVASAKGKYFVIVGRNLGAYTLTVSCSPGEYIRLHYKGDVANLEIQYRSITILYCDGYYYYCSNQQEITYGITRPANVPLGFSMVDSSLSPKRPIWYIGDNTWVDATGTSV